MNPENYIKLVNFAWDIAQKSPEPIKTEVFKITYSTLLTQTSTDFKTTELDPEMIIDDKSLSSHSNFEKKLHVFANNCNLSASDLKDFYYIDDEEIYILPALTGSDAEKQTIATQCILTSYQMLFGKEWLDSQTLMKCVSDSKVEGMDHFARNMRRRKNILIRGRGRGAVLEYKITNIGKLETFDILHNLIKGEKQ